MAIVTATEVKAIMDNCQVENAIVESMIADAEEMVNTIFAEDTDITATMLKSITKWFTAHMLASTLHRSTAREAAGDADVTYTGKWADGLNSTPYGQMVLQLDTTGKMAAAGKRRATIKAIKSFE